MIYVLQDADLKKLRKFKACEKSRLVTQSNESLDPYLC